MSGFRLLRVSGTVVALTLITVVIMICDIICWIMFCCGHHHYHYHEYFMMIGSIAVWELEGLGFSGFGAWMLWASG